MGSTLPDGYLLERDADVAFVGDPGEHESLVHYSVRNNNQKSKPPAEIRRFARAKAQESSEAIRKQDHQPNEIRYQEEG
jgi:hypothetical protein